jgi:hypothetical protein
MAPDSWTKYDGRVRIALLGGSIGAAGWILGAVDELVAEKAGLLDIGVVVLCALGVLLTGFVLWRSYVAGRRLSTFWMIEALLGASFVFGMLAVCWMDARGVLAFATSAQADHGQPGNQIWEALARHTPARFAYAAPVILLAMMALVCWHPLRRRMLGAHTHIQRGAPEGQFQRGTDLLTRSVSEDT